MRTSMRRLRADAPRTRPIRTITATKNSSRRDTQAGLGLLTGVAVFGTALGGLFSLVFAFAYGRLGALRARGTSALLALFGFVSVAIVPFLKYPPNPPAVGNRRNDRAAHRAFLRHGGDFHRGGGVRRVAATAHAGAARRMERDAHGAALRISS